ncbi:hypothetical protein HK57_00203 [Aspergillus ustus]|uniref:Methyltransferase type 11 domain-containing protein n=1 Tax=Aspergillus ustus TaxID=40382 RepID=A0A0C1EF97_ASPUT|nr:hypothetical protein HK57_00203 [Aspergillus ustus]
MATSTFTSTSSIGTGTSTDKIFAQDNKFWEIYSRGRPSVPPAFWSRIFTYHASKTNTTFNTVHDIGAGNGPYAQNLRSRFANVIVSDIVAENVALARERLSGQTGFTFRIAPLESRNGITPESIDMVFAANVMHFAEPQAFAMETIASQIKCGGTFAAAMFGPARFVDRDADIQNLWERISAQGGRELLDSTDNMEKGKKEQLLKVMARTEGRYNVAPLDKRLWKDEVRIYLNMKQGGILGMLPPEIEFEREPDYRAGDRSVEEGMEGWTFRANLEGLKEHFGSFPFVSQFPEAFVRLYEELEGFMSGGRVVEGYFPVVIILATRK